MSARPTRAKADREPVQPLAPALADLLNPAIGKGTAGVGAQTGLGPSVVAATRELLPGAARREAATLAAVARNASEYGAVPGLLQWSPALRMAGGTGAALVAADAASELAHGDEEVKALVDKAFGEEPSTCPVP